MAKFQDLPVEIRLQIYNYLFTSQHSHLLLHLELSKTYLSEIPTHRGIISVSKQCLEEAYSLHTNTLTHLVVETGLFNLFHAYDQRYDATVPYDKLFRHILSRVALYPHHTALLTNIQTLTIPSFISASSILHAVSTSVLPSLKTIEFVACDAPMHDVYPSTPLHGNGREHHTVSWGQYRHSSNVVHERATRKFLPAWHRARARFDWDAINSRELQERWACSPDPFRVLWTVRTKWKRQRVSLRDDEPIIIYQSSALSMSGPSCYTVEFIYTYDFTNEELVDVRVLSQTDCEIRGCPNRDDQAAFLDYLGPEGSAILEVSGKCKIQLDEVSRSAMAS